MNSNHASFLPQLEETTHYTDWLRQLDITTYDYPYIDPLLMDAYGDWRKQVSDLPGLDEASFMITDYLGKALAADPEILLSAAGDTTQPSPMMNMIMAAVNEQKSIIKEVAGSIYAAVPMFTRLYGERFAIFGCRLTGYDIAAADLFMKMAAELLRTCFYQCFEALLVSDLLLAQQRAKREEQRRSKLSFVVQKLHDKIDVDSVLTELFERLSGMYPAARLELLMSQDHLSRDPRIKSLQIYDQEDDLCVQAFIEGSMQVRRLHGEREGEKAGLEIAVPLSGKQGIYGVFHLSMKHDLIDEIDLQLIDMLAETAGTAFENARLYEQSNLLINELRLINELTKRLNQSLQIDDVFQFAMEELLSIFKSEYCCISQLNREHGTFEIVSSNVPGLANERFPSDYGFSGQLYATNEPIILSDYRAYGSNINSRFMEETESRSLITAPVIVSGEAIGGIMLAHRQPHFFSYDNYKLLQVLSSHIGLAVANAQLHAEVRWMANRDMLTGLYARHYVDNAIQEFQMKDSNGSLIIVDIDQFKQVNDTFGHQVGDKILKQVCQIVKGTIRKTDIAARWGGEELAVYLPGAAASSAYKIAEMVRLRVAMETEPKVTVSCGIAEWQRGKDKLGVESLFYQADMALYRAKNNGRNQTHTATGEQGL
ncbi:sensor domain-containing diguanylate cyclase [Paenibacillus sanguinis]|uniref:sensor domain-containing diguanylate cyclase n=1 Tax=Paenibacillus sanguinis TaxID=225906 RepID=UPI00036E4112|nr:diguanylate cyclase [Paenibacillus sanguinis]